MGIIYVATNMVNGKMYIGMAKRSLLARRKEHERVARAGSTLRFHRALRKYGVSCFNWQILYKDIPSSKLGNLETRCIAEFHTVKNGYNMSDGGDGGYCEENPGAAAKGRPKTKEHRLKISASLKGHGLSDEAKEKIAASRRGKPSPRRGAVLSIETRAKISASHKGKKVSEERKVRQREIINTIPRDDVTGRLMRRE